MMMMMMMMIKGNGDDDDDDDDDDICTQKWHVWLSVSGNLYSVAILWKVAQKMIRNNFKAHFTLGMHIQKKLL